MCGENFLGCIIHLEGNTRRVPKFPWARHRRVQSWMCWISLQHLFLSCSFINHSISVHLADNYCLSEASLLCNLWLWEMHGAAGSPFLCQPHGWGCCSPSLIRVLQSHPSPFHARCFILSLASLVLCQIPHDEHFTCIFSPCSFFLKYLKLLKLHRV